MKVKNEKHQKNVRFRLVWMGLKGCFFSFVITVKGDTYSNTGGLDSWYEYKTSPSVNDAQ